MIILPPDDHVVPLKASVAAVGLGVPPPNINAAVFDVPALPDRARGLVISPATVVQELTLRLEVVKENPTLPLAFRLPEIIADPVKGNTTAVDANDAVVANEEVTAKDEVIANEDVVDSEAVPNKLPVATIHPVVGE